jgi:hypothetical protein
VPIEDAILMDNRWLARLNQAPASFDHIFPVLGGRYVVEDLTSEVVAAPAN